MRGCKKQRRASTLDCVEGLPRGPHLDFTPLPSRVGREDISVVLSHLVGGDLLWQSEEITTNSKGDLRLENQNPKTMPKTVYTVYSVVYPQ